LFLIRYTLPPLLALCLAGCPNGVSLRGDLLDAAGNTKPSVVDISGEGLPGVAVVVYGSEAQALTDARGQYRLNAPRGFQQVDFAKTGYTPARVMIEAGDAGSVDMPQAVMWPLPDAQGIYAFENNRYRSLTRVEPKRFLAGETQSIFASKKGAETFIDGKKLPMLVVFRLPSYDLQLVRLRQAEVTPSEAGASAEGYKVPVWVAEGRLPMHTQPVDSPEGLLVQLVPDATLDAGDYAIHWGAYDGFNTTDARAYLFRILPEAPPPGEAPPAEEAPAEEAKPKEESKKGAKKKAE
jgi:hypothetical protein